MKLLPFWMPTDLNYLNPMGPLRLSSEPSRLEPQLPIRPRFLSSHPPALALLAAFAEAFGAAWDRGDDIGQAWCQIHWDAICSLLGKVLLSYKQSFDAQTAHHKTWNFFLSECLQISQLVNPHGPSETLECPSPKPQFSHVSSAPIAPPWPCSRPSPKLLGLPETAVTTWAKLGRRKSNFLAVVCQIPSDVICQTGNMLLWEKQRSNIQATPCNNRCMHSCQ